jgi:hypothetical protein
VTSTVVVVETGGPAGVSRSVLRIEPSLSSDQTTPLLRTTVIGRVRFADEQG